MVFKFLKKISVLIFIFSLSIVFNIILQNSAEAKCARDSNDAIKVDTVDQSAGNTTAFALTGTTDYDQDNCGEEPLFYRVTFYKLALCTSDPYNEGTGLNPTGVAPDLSSCTDLWSDTSGKTVVIQPDKNTDLLEGFEIGTGTYTHAFILLSNHIDVKHYERFALKSNGKAATIYGYKDSGDQTGAYCWTKSVTTTYNNDYSKTLHGETIPAQQTGTSASDTLVCDSSAPTTATASYDYATEIIDHFGDDNVTDDVDAFRNFSDYSTMDGIDGKVAANLMQSDGSTLATTVANGVRIAHFQTLSPVLNIDLNTIGMRLSFNTSESVSFDTAVNTSDEIHAIKVGADPFGVNYTLISAN